MANHLEADALLTVKAMYETDRRAIAAGTSGVVLMERAGRAIADEALDMRAPGDVRPVAILCGPGSNGGDGFVAARLLVEAGADVRLGLLGDRAALSGDAAVMAELWRGGVAPLEPSLFEGAGLVVDALFGAGLNRDLGGRAREVCEALAASRVPALAADVPSGLDGDTGLVRGFCAPATRTVTFVRAKPGHVLTPGRALCGRLVVADIGVSDDIVAAARTFVRRNTPAGFAKALVRPGWEQHKYDRGHVVVLSGGRARTGAARLAAAAAARALTGAVTVAGPPDAIPELAAHLTSAMIREIETGAALEDFIRERRIRSVVAGPGCGLGARTVDLVSAALRSGAACVLDADALTSFRDDPEALFAMTRDARAVLTPHAGEFARLFPDLVPARIGALAAAREAAARSGAVIVLKGAATVIAGPGGRAAINENAPPDLATAGSGDVLAGLIAGPLAAQPGVDPFEAGCAGVWVHGACGALAGFGLIADDLPAHAPAAFAAALDAVERPHPHTDASLGARPLDGAPRLR